VRAVIVPSMWLGLVCAGCGASDLFVNANLGKNDDCEYLPDEENAIGFAEFDGACGAAPGSTACAHPYLAHLLVQNENTEDVVVESAQVVLQSIQHQTIQFNRTDPVLPNPFLVTIGEPVPGRGKAVVFVETIPLDYAGQLDGFVGGEVQAELELEGATSDGGDVGSNRFRFSIMICEGCRTLCGSDPAAAGSDQGCSSHNLGVERELCIDPEC